MHRYGKRAGEQTGKFMSSVRCALILSKGHSQYDIWQYGAFSFLVGYCLLSLLALMPNTRVQFLSFELACKFLRNNKLIILTKPKHCELLSI